MSQEPPFSPGAVGALADLGPFGVIGTGNLGSQLVRTLLRRGAHVVVFDRDQAAVRRLVEAGASPGGSVGELAESCPTVVTCLPSPSALAGVLLEGDGLLTGPARGLTWVDMGTTGPAEEVRLARAALDAGVEVLEAPVTGGVHRAALGELTVLAGGAPETFTRLRPLLDAFASQVYYLGALGQASRMKVITNLLAFVNLVGLGEALMLAERVGIDLGVAYGAIRHSSGNSFVHETESQLILSGSYDIGFTVDLALKDLGFALDLALEGTVPLELGSLVHQRFVRAKARYGGDALSPRVVQLLEDDLGVQLRAPGFPKSLLAEGSEVGAASPGPDGGGPRDGLLVAAREKGSWLPGAPSASDGRPEPGGDGRPEAT